MLVVIGMIVVLVGLLLTALSGVWSQGKMTKAMNNMKQIAQWMRLYSTDNSEFIVPSQFNYSQDPYPGKVRSEVNIGEEHMGTWTDILWTVFEVNPFAKAAGAVWYQYDSPDKDLYDSLGGWDGNPLRSSVTNSEGVKEGDLPKPFGKGADEVGYPGYFAANNFFNADKVSEDSTYNGWFASGQIRFPSQSMYLVDSFAGETIEDEVKAFGEDPMGQVEDEEIEVDYRYGEACLMLFLDGHIASQTPWQDIEQLKRRRVRVLNLTQP